MKRMLWLHTGGTIACTQSEDGLSPSFASSTLLQILGNLIGQYEIFTEDLFTLDSSNIQPEEWAVIAKRIAENVFDYDGIVVTHGTDTMAYTASALSFMLKNCPIPVVLTGSQLPLDHPLSDGVDNLRCAFAMAASEKAGVYVAFNRKIILGARAVKVRTTSFDAFESVNYPYVGIVDSSGLRIFDELIPVSHGEFECSTDFCKEVMLIKLIPGMNPKILDAMASLHIKGVVIEAFGIGGLSFVRRDFSEKIAQLTTQGIAVVVCSQCLYESADFSRYEVGKKALVQGVIEARDMTSEACVTKLMWALGQTQDASSVKDIMMKPLVNEIGSEDVEKEAQTA